MKTKIIVLILLITISVKCYYCPAYNCTDTYEYNSGETCCQMKDIDPVTYFITPCASSDDVCNIQYGETTTQCTSKTNVTSLYPGETCSSNTECYSGNCLKNVCVGQKEGATCINDADCDIDLGCILQDQNSTCKALASEGQECGESIKKCKNYLACHDGKCIQPFSVKIGSPATQPLVCESYYIFQSPMSGINICTEAPTSITESGFGLFELQKCNNSGESCSYTLVVEGENTTITRPCECGKTNSSSFYCPAEIGDLPDQLQYYKDYILAKPHCHISQRFCNTEAAKLNTTYYKALVGFNELTRGYEFVDNPDCVKETINFKYWQALNLSGETTNSTSLGIRRTNIGEMFLMLGMGFGISLFSYLG